VIVPDTGHSGLRDMMKARRERVKETKEEKYRERKKRRGRDMFKGKRERREGK
jgi:hypothetical protein